MPTCGSPWVTEAMVPVVSIAGADGLDQLCESQPPAEPAGVSLGLDEIAPDWFVAGVEFEHESDWPAAIGCGHALSVAARAGLRIGEDPLSFRLLPRSSTLPGCRSAMDRLRGCPQRQEPSC